MEEEEEEDKTERRSRKARRLVETLARRCVNSHPPPIQYAADRRHLTKGLDERLDGRPRWDTHDHYTVRL